MSPEKAFLSREMPFSYLSAGLGEKADMRWKDFPGYSTVRLAGVPDKTYLSNFLSVVRLFKPD